MQEFVMSVDVNVHPPIEFEQDDMSNVVMQTGMEFVTIVQIFHDKVLMKDSLAIGPLRTFYVVGCGLQHFFGTVGIPFLRVVNNLPSKMGIQIAPYVREKSPMVFFNFAISISTSPEARQIAGPTTPSQIKNFTLSQHLQEIHGRVTSMITGLPSIASDILSPALGTIYGVACDLVTPLFQTMLDHLESCILQIHDPNFGTLSMDATMDNNASPYMEELQESILHFWIEFLSWLLPSSGAISVEAETICTRLVRSMASRVLIFFIRHASLVRPLSESGKLRMARDMAELELVVGQHLFPVEQLGAPYRALRAFWPVIFLETSQMGESPLLQDLPPSVILHHLYSRGPKDLQSPLQRNKLTPVQYSLWMDSQGEDQIWKGIKSTLDDYAAKVRARGD
ncbi:conserved oligomeric Golgi complex subunit 5 [Olea europaea subsp. europaea]|uniref:Conserved oligomeric Golgi complex subunit 5 n=1 Tax=Olea europaea subsp. europaea TaxID=158383 RepID=A0A8S0RG30_OLEEU|nr:conserved oligomeric Golgi complex subunit 5 [Olea europaea subsp. europaea]